MTGRRLGAGNRRAQQKKTEILKRLYPDKLRPRALRAVYVSLAMPDLVERAEREGVWVLKATNDVVKPKV